MIPSLFRRRRLTLGYTAQDFAAHIGVNPTLYRRWESVGFKNIAWEKVKAIDEALTALEAVCER